MTPDMLHAQGFAVSFPGQISRQIWQAKFLEYLGKST